MNCVTELHICLPISSDFLHGGLPLVYMVLAVLSWNSCIVLHGDSSFTSADLHGDSHLSCVLHAAVAANHEVFLGILIIMISACFTWGIAM